MNRIPTRPRSDQFQPDEMNTLNGPLRPTRLRFKLSMACRKRSSPAVDIPETSYCSHSMGALTCSKISLTESVISAPTPSPGIKVTYVILNFEYHCVGTTQIVTHGVNTSIFGRKLHTNVGVSFALSQSSRGSYSACYSRETGSEGRGGSLENDIRSGIIFRAKEVLKLTLGARIDLEEPARALRSIIRGMDGGGQGKEQGGGCKKPVIGNIRSAVKKNRLDQTRADQARSLTARTALARSLPSEQNKKTLQSGLYLLFMPS